MYLEDLCNELLLETLEYVDVYQLFITFYGLNRRFTDLILQCHLHLCFKHSNNEAKVWDLIISTINFSKIREMSYHHNYFIDRRFLVSKCSNMRSITFRNMNGYFIQVILKDIPLINQIKHIHIEYPKFLTCSNDAPIRDFSLKTYHRQFKSLVTCLLDVSINPYQNSDIPIIFPKLRRISLDEHYWRTSIVEFLQTNTPNLRSLYIRTDTYTPYQPSLSNYQICLRRLHIEWHICRKCPFIDGFEWQKIIEKYWPLIRYLSFDFRYSELNEQFLDTFYKNKYWISKNLDPAVWKIHSCSNHILTICF